MLKERPDGLYNGTTKIIDFIPRVVSVRKVSSSRNVKTIFLIEIWKNGEIMAVASVESLFVSSWFQISHHCSDAALSGKIRKMIQQYMEEQAAELPVLSEFCLDRTGWFYADEGCGYFRNNTIICKGPAKVFSRDGTAHVIKTEICPDFLCGCDEILSMIKKAAPGTSWIIYLVSYFDILKALFRKAGYPIAFITNFFGKSRSGKTSLVKAICGISHVISFQSSKRRDRIMREIKEMSGETVLADDFHPAEAVSDYDRQGCLKDSLVRMTEEIADAPNIIITSEYLEGHISLQDRELQIYLEETVKWEVLSSLNSHQKELDNIRKAFYIQVVAHEDILVQEISEFCAKADRERLKKNGFRSLRYGDYICCVNYLFHKFFLNVYGIEQTYDIEHDLQIQLERQEKHMEILEVMENNSTYLIAVRDMLLDKEILRQVPDWRIFVPDSKTYYIDSDGNVYIAPKALHRGLMIYLHTKSVPIKKVVRELVDADAIVTYETGNDLTKKHNGKRYYEVDTDTLNEYCRMFEE